MHTVAPTLHLQSSGVDFWLDCTRVHACTHDQDRFIDLWSNAVLVALMLASVASQASTGVMTYPGCVQACRQGSVSQYAMNRRSATYLGMTISRRSGPF
jgi:hypothetical protein